MSQPGSPGTGNRKGPHGCETTTVMMTNQFSESPQVRLVAEPPNKDTDLQSVVIGSLVAGACADALGWGTEFMRTPSAIETQLGLSRVEDYVGWRKRVGGRFNTYI